MAENRYGEIRILVADDEENITDFIAYTLEREGYKVEKAYDGRETLDTYHVFKPHLIILDIMMPIFDGYEICRRLKDQSVGIIMLTAKNDLIDKILGLDLGADDYLTKPFEMVELLARVRSLSRRMVTSSRVEDDGLKWGGLEVDFLSRLVKIDGLELVFKPKEFDLLAFLLKNENIVFTRDEILSGVWDMDYFGGTRTIDIHIQRIRKKLDIYSKIIVTIPKVGYKAVNPFE